AKVEMFKFNNGYWGGPSPVNLTIFGTITEEQKQEALKEALFKFDSINFSIIPERIQETIKRANASGIISVTEDSDIVVRAEIAHNGEFVYDITITAKNTGRAVMTLNKDGSIVGYETKEPFDPKKEAEKAQQLVEQSRKDIESQRKKAAEKMNEIQQTFKK
ncbi:lipoprotein EnvF, partial [Salmonella enterica]|nr:lipoprotein EnvF [Salmonella enterica]